MEDGHRVLAPEPGVEQLQADLAQGRLVAGLQGTAELVRRLGHLGLEPILLAGDHHGVDPAGRGVEDPLEPLLGVDRPVRDDRHHRPGAQRHRQEDADGDERVHGKQHDHTLICTIFRIIAAPTSWKAAVIISILLPSGVVYNGAT